MIFELDIYIKGFQTCKLYIFVLDYIKIRPGCVCVRLTLLSLSLLAIIIAKGVKEAHGGKVNVPVFDMTTYLRKMNM